MKPGFVHLAGGGDVEPLARRQFEKVRLGKLVRPHFQGRDDVLGVPICTGVGQTQDLEHRPLLAVTIELLLGQFRLEPKEQLTQPVHVKL